MAFDTVFDARTDLHDTAAWLPFLLMIPVACFLFARRDLLRVSPVLSLIVPMFLLIGAFVFPGLSYLGVYLQHRTVRAAFDSGRYTVVEGPVAQFVQFWTRHVHPSGESFTVRDHRFAYSCDGTSPPVFHDCTGLIRNGRIVRIAYSGETILRVEVAR